MRGLKFAAVVLTASLATAANGTTCTQAIGRCKLEGTNKPSIEMKCQAAGDACMRNGVFIGPITGTVWKNLRKE